MKSSNKLHNLIINLYIPDTDSFFGNFETLQKFKLRKVVAYRYCKTQ